MGSLVHNARDHATYGLFSAVPVDDLEDLVGGAPGRVEGLCEGGRLPDLHAALHDAEEGHRHGAHRPPPAGLVAFLQQNYRVAILLGKTVPINLVPDSSNLLPRQDDRTSKSKLT